MMMRNPSLRRQFLDDRGIQLLCKAFCDTKNHQSQELAQHAHLILCAFMYDFPNLSAIKLERGDMNDIFQAVAQIAGQLSEMGSSQLAINAYEVALQLDPNNPDLLMLCGVLHTQQGQFDEGQDKLRRSLAVRPGSPIAAYNLAKIIVKQSEATLGSQTATIGDSVSREALREAAELLQGAIPTIRMGAPKRQIQLPGMKALQESKEAPRRLTHPLTSPVFSLLVMVLEKLGRPQEVTRTRTTCVKLITRIRPSSTQRSGRCGA